MQLSAEYLRDKAGQRAIAEPMPGSIRLVLSAYPNTDHHIDVAIDQFCDHGRCTCGVVGGVAVHKDKDVGFHVAEHAAHNMALTLLHLAPYHRVVYLREF